MGRMTIDPQSSWTLRKHVEILIRGRILRKIPIEILLCSAKLLPFSALAGHFTVACLNAFLLHSQRSVHIVKLEIESASVTHGLSAGVASPQCGGAGLAVRTLSSYSLTDDQSLFGSDERPVLSVHLLVQSAGIAEVVARSITPPQRGGSGPTVHTLTRI